jgi:hypothetical protein
MVKWSSCKIQQILGGQTFLVNGRETWGKWLHRLPSVWVESEEGNMQFVKQLVFGFLVFTISVGVGCRSGFRSLVSPFPPVSHVPPCDPASEDLWHQRSGCR